MIIRESEDLFTMTAQHDHAIFAGVIASNFRNALFLDEAYMEEAILAIKEHDRGWIRIDEIPIWDDQTHRPFSFMNYPLPPKLMMYAKGIDEVEEASVYAAWLCSLHYTSFTHIRHSTHPDGIAFYTKEIHRQARISRQLMIENPDMLHRHLSLLQLCDELSLYVCFNKPGASKQDEHPWYIEGFETEVDDQKYMANWVSQRAIKLTPFPFAGEFRATLLTKHVPKDLRSRIGIESAYKETPMIEQEIIFVGD